MDHDVRDATEGREPIVGRRETTGCRPACILPAFTGGRMSSLAQDAKGTGGWGARDALVWWFRSSLNKIVAALFLSYRRKPVSTAEMGPGFRRENEIGDTAN